MENTPKKELMAITTLLPEGVLVDVCDLNKTPQDIISDAITAACAGGGGQGISLDDFYEEISSLADIIIKDPSFLNCDKANCVFEELLNSGNGLFCSTIGNFIGTPDYRLKLKVVENSGQIYGTDGVTSEPDATTGVITILLNEAFVCGEDNHALEVGGTLLHEGIHAEMYRKCMENGFDYLDPDSYAEIWDVNLELKFPGFEPPYQTAQHEIMAIEFVDEIANALYIFNNQDLTIEHYKYIAWSGLEVYGEHLGFVSQYLSEYWDEHQELISSSNTTCQ